MRVRDFLGMKPSVLGLKEKIDALNAALLLVCEAEDRGDPLPPLERMPYGTQDTWDGIKANLMHTINELWEEMQALQEREK